MVEVMRKLLLFFVLASIMACTQQQDTAEQGVVINGVRWATRNVDAPGTFAATPESAGMFFQWNKRKGWDITGWDSSIPINNTWIRENDPCPQGWRVPTAHELYSLMNAGSTRTTKNGVTGYLFGAAMPYQIFLPVAGFRSGNYGNLHGTEWGGSYWSRTPYDSENAWILSFPYYDDAAWLYVTMYEVWNLSGLSVRCVAMTDEEREQARREEAIRRGAEAVARNRQNQSSSISNSLEGVVINGIRWATRNVDAPGTFAASPESTGMTFQWNRRQGWSGTDENVSGWDSSTPTGNTWERENDPCPTGWRVPTQAELQSLSNAGSTWTTLSGVDGRVFGTAPNQIFLPLVGWRNFSSGALNVSLAYYWSRTQSDSWEAQSLFFGGGIDMLTTRPRAAGLPIRCVAE